MKKIIMLVAALLFTAGVAFADGKNGSCGTGKCGDSKKEMKKNASCGTGKCGGEMKKEMKKSGSCGTGKCGDSMRDTKSHGQQGEMMKKSGNKAKGSCGTGKCGK
jgi:uncharacterized low-complexity protein